MMPMTASLTSTLLSAAMAIVLLAGWPSCSVAQTTLVQVSAQQHTLAPYKAIAITLPAILLDQSLDAFRKRLGAIAQRKDRVALAELVAGNFFWIPDDTDIADKTVSAIENVAKALDLDDIDPAGWEKLAAYAFETNIVASQQLSGVFCAPAQPDFDDEATDELFRATQTDASEWGYPLHEDVEVRSTPSQGAPVVAKLGWHLVRMLVEDSQSGSAADTFRKILTPSGVIGYVKYELVLPNGADQLCYVRESGAWRIAGFLGGEQNP
jgi:hypothetical protein